jgi:hypothetical protein
LSLVVDLGDQDRVLTLLVEVGVLVAFYKALLV